LLGKASFAIACCQAAVLLTAALATGADRPISKLAMTTAPRTVEPRRSSELIDVFALDRSSR
jgi:hypothetical protein